MRLLRLFTVHRPFLLLSLLVASWTNRLNRTYFLY
jgi:hypothetical protein